ncbi:hypothetical protein B0E45_09615 [Sinorhizobium sp. A49]|uniref:hypothetical protein n=1 Tax=Sinorhizobium sp. A49 TaxID=1945861 RepID=UPI00098671E3|nr:hypothetical protein [Sinorhizobium sp. A49]OOG71995.1 hypothetical protein B0E45_09615 [Sinorhizobium sp. A49]
MSKKPKRDNAHYEQRLKAEFPDIYGDVLAGRISSLRKALVIAGLKPQRTRLEKLKNSWAKATPGEREGFLTWLAISGVLPTASHSPVADTASLPPFPAGGPIASGRYLLPSTITRIKAIMAKRRVKPDDVMGEMGFLSDGQSLARALAKNASLRLAVIAGLEAWLRTHED